MSFNNLRERQGKIIMDIYENEIDIVLYMCKQTVSTKYIHVLRTASEV